jgi:hypothetical protein
MPPSGCGQTRSRATTPLSDYTTSQLHKCGTDTHVAEDFHSAMRLRDDTTTQRHNYATDIRVAAAAFHAARRPNSDVTTKLPSPTATHCNTIHQHSNTNTPTPQHNNITTQEHNGHRRSGGGIPRSKAITQLSNDYATDIHAAAAEHPRQGDYTTTQLNDYSCGPTRNKASTKLSNYTRTTTS